MLNRLFQKIKDSFLKAKEKIRLHWKLYLFLAVILIAYMFYAGEVRQPEVQTLDDLKASLPMAIDDNTTIVKIEDLEKEFVMHIVKADSVYLGTTIEQRDKSLDKIAKNAQGLCANPILGNIISSGRKLTVLLQDESHTFERKIVIEKCELAIGPN